MAETEAKPRCFIAMPIRTRKPEAELYADDHHWLHVRETLFVKAIKAAGYEPVLPEARGSYLIHERIVKHLEECELVLCDLSGNNPNVFFELGVRTSLDKPIALVWDGLTELPFDTGGIHTHKYDSKLTPWQLDDELDKMRQHILDSAESCGDTNPLWRQFGLTIRAKEPQTNESPLEAKLDLLLQRQDVSRQDRDQAYATAAHALAESDALRARLREVDADPTLESRRLNAARRQFSSWLAGYFSTDLAESGGRQEYRLEGPTRHDAKTMYLVTPSSLEKRDRDEIRHRAMEMNIDVMFDVGPLDLEG